MYVMHKCNKKLIRRWDSVRELSLRRQRTTKYNWLLHKFRYRSFSATQVYQIQWNNPIWRPLHRLRSFKVTDFCTNRKLIYDFLLVINTNLTLRYFIEFGKHVFQHAYLWRNFWTSLLYFVLRVRCGRKESSRSLFLTSHESAAPRSAAPGYMPVSALRHVTALSIAGRCRNIACQNSACTAFNIHSPTKWQLLI